MPMTALNPIATANNASRGDPTTRTTTARAVIRALNRVKTFLRMISATTRRHG
jgi:hypothetical protein